MNSLGLLDLVEIAAKGLAPRAQYQVYLADSNHSPFGQRESLAFLKTNPDGAGVVQVIGPLKILAMRTSESLSAPSQRFLIVAESGDANQVVLQQSTSTGIP